MKKIGIHNPELSSKFLKLIEEGVKRKFVDVSWGNDLLDSIMNEELDIQIYIPNAEVEDLEEEEFTDFQISTISNDEILLETKSVEEVIKFINDREENRGKKIVYLKTVKLANNIASAIKITEKGVLYVTEIEISISEQDETETMEEIVAWYRKEFNVEDCSKADFDAFYIDAVKNINELSKL